MSSRKEIRKSFLSFMKPFKSILPSFRKASASRKEEMRGVVKFRFIHFN